MGPVRRIRLGSWRGSSNPSVRTGFGMYDYRLDLPLINMMVSSYEVEDIEPQEDGKPL